MNDKKENAVRVNWIIYFIDHWNLILRIVNRAKRSDNDFLRIEFPWKLLFVWKIKNQNVKSIKLKYCIVIYGSINGKLAFFILQKWLFWRENKFQGMVCSGIFIIIFEMPKQFFVNKNNDKRTKKIFLLTYRFVKFHRKYCPLKLLNGGRMNGKPIVYEWNLALEIARLKRISPYSCVGDRTWSK